MMSLTRVLLPKPFTMMLLPVQLRASVNYICLKIVTSQPSQKPMLGDTKLVNNYFHLFYHLLLKSYYMVMVSLWTVAITCQGYPYRLQHGETCPPIRGACGSVLNMDFCIPPPSLFLITFRKTSMHYVRLLQGRVKKKVKVWSLINLEIPPPL